VSTMNKVETVTRKIECVFVMSSPSNEKRRLQQIYGTDAMRTMKTRRLSKKCETKKIRFSTTLT